MLPVALVIEKPNRIKSRTTEKRLLNTFPRAVQVLRKTGNMGKIKCFLEVQRPLGTAREECSISIQGVERTTFVSLVQRHEERELLRQNVSD